MSHLPPHLVAAPTHRWVLMKYSEEDLHHWYILKLHQGLLEVAEEALLVLEVKEAPDTWSHRCFSETVAADLDCMVAQECENLPGLDSPVVSQFQAVINRKSFCNASTRVTRIYFWDS